MSVSLLRRESTRRLARVRAVVRLEFLHLLHDRTALALIVTVPALQILLFGYAVNLNPKAVPLAIARAQGDPFDQLHRTIDETGYFTILADRLALGAAEQMVRDGKALVGVEFPSMEGSDPDTSLAVPRIVVDATDPAAVRPALATLETAYWKHVAQTSPFVFSSPAEVEWLYNPEGRTTWTIVPGLAGVVVMISMLLLGALTLVRERERGSWETLLATPVDAIDALIGKLSPYILLGVLQVMIVIGVARFLFAVPATGAVWALLLATPVYAAAHLI